MQSKSGFALNQQLIGWPGDSFKLKLEEVLVMSLHEVLSRTYLESLCRFDGG
jgi:hypothetical protein